MCSVFPQLSLESECRSDCVCKGERHDYEVFCRSTINYFTSISLCDRLWYVGIPKRLTYVLIKKINNNNIHYICGSKSIKGQKLRNK